MQVEKLKTIDADTLLSTPMRKTLFVVDGLIPQGLSVLSGSSKIGKSWLMLWLGIQVARGQPVWEFETHKSDVLYLCLEDTYARIQSRLYQITDEAPPETSHCYNEFSNRERLGTANRTVSFRLSENKTCHYRHLSKGKRFKKHRRKKRNVCRRLRRCIGAEKYFG